jgi:hypothetical protein
LTALAIEALTTVLVAGLAWVVATIVLAVL